MRTLTIPAARRFGVIIRGDLPAAREAAGNAGTQRPLRRVSASRHAIHAELLTDRATLDRWWSSIPHTEPGALLFFQSLETETPCTDSHS